MEKLITLDAVAAPLPFDNLDTDQLMPKQFLRGIDKSGLAAGLLYNMRFLPTGELNPDCILNRSGFKATRILCAGPNFGCGSSREHAVWGLYQFGIRAVIAPSFGEIFYSNCFNNGLLAARVSAEVSCRLFSALARPEPKKLSISVVDRTITTAEGEVYPFALGKRHRTMLLEGLDAVAATLRDRDEIAAWQAAHEKAFPWMAKLPGRLRRAHLAAGASVDSHSTNRE